MLELKNITKTYPAGGEAVEALKGIDLQFRESDFVSILGPSGCGKTTMLNIIGGLDQYTSGDLVINGKSTKDFKDRDWDAYRNHSIGFVFQSYNLIPHQTVLQNVELALTLSGVSKAERRRRAKEALEKVGLTSQLKKRPNEMSGGQMQRVAIARAIVNDPDIILADEPTGALDTETSVQVMDILKEISKDRLIIMVTHNPDLAERYSTRIIQMLDGEITNDSAPLTEEELRSASGSVSTSGGMQAEGTATTSGEMQAENTTAASGVQSETTNSTTTTSGAQSEPSGNSTKPSKKAKKPSMSFTTAFGLSLKNLFTKKGRTVLTAFAGSIGIIGIALIFAVSNGMTSYIDTVQEDTLSSYPLTLQSQNVDLTSLMETFMNAATSEEVHENDAVYQKPMIENLVNAMTSIETSTNDLAAFKQHLEDRLASEAEDAPLREALSGIQYTYNLDFQVYTENVDGTILHSDTTELMQKTLAKYMGGQMSSADGTGSSSMGGGSGFSSMMMGGQTASGLWQEMLPGENGKLINPVLEKQYDLVYGSWPTEFDEIVLVLDANNELADIALYALGLIPEADVDAIMQAVINVEAVELDSRSWTYEEICEMDFRTVLPSDCYVLDESSGLYTDLRDSDAGLQYLYANGTPLKVSGIIRPNEAAVSSMLTGSIAYTSKLTEYIIEQAQNSDAVKTQQADKTIDIFTGLPFSEASGILTDEQKESEFRNYINGLSAADKAQAYIEIMSIPSEEELAASVEQTMSGMTRADMEAALVQSLSTQMGMNTETIESYLTSMSDEEMTEMFRGGVAEQVKAQYAAAVAGQLSAMTTEQLAGALDAALPTYTTEQCATYHDEILTFSDTTYEDNLVKLGCLDLAVPSSINLFSSTFKNKDVIEEAILEYNASVEEVSQISYTDYIGLMMSSITTIINAITYVLIAFVAISLIVSSIMIGVITLISVQERTKEIGILRAIGASKRNVSSMFNAETIIIGFSSGLLGVVVTYLLCIPINLILHSLTGINNLSAFLPVPAAVILILISTGLTLISGVIPSRSAAKKDPVVALRTE